jgi:hypothetical protein
MIFDGRLASEWARRAKRERRHVASRNPLRALAARTDLRHEYLPPPSTHYREHLIKEKGNTIQHSTTTLKQVKNLYLPPTNK